MRVTFVGPFGLRPKMTISRRALPLARALAARGHVVHLIIPPWDCRELSGLTWTEGGVEVVNVRVGKDASLSEPARIAAMLVRRTWASRPDVLHCFKPKAYAGLVAGSFWLARQAGLWSGRLFVDTDDWEGEGGWNEIKGYSKAQRWSFAFQERWGIRHCDGVTAASVWLTEQVRALCAGRSAEVHYLPNGVECGDYVGNGPMCYDDRVEGRKAASRPPTVLLYSRFVEHEASDVISIWRRVVERMPQARLMVVGQGLGGEEAELRLLAREAGVCHSMEMKGWVEKDELTELIAGADVALMPVRDTLVSRAKSPARLLDVMASGLPVVAHAVGEWVEVLDHGSCGVLVPPLADEACAAEVVKLLEDPGRRRQIGENARRRACSVYDWRRLAATAEAAYLGAAASAPASWKV